MPEELVPPVVAVVVTADPAPSFEGCLATLRDQDYPNLTILVVDDASAEDVTARVAAVAPEAIVRRRPERGGFAAGADEALVGIEGATFFLFCHDDVALATDAVSELVAESFRSNAAVVGAKVVRFDDPRRLLQVGMGMHRLGTPAPRVEPGELDQSQHDEAREVFAVPSCCLLARADLFEALGGFDPAMTLFGEDLDLCWRAQLAGGRVVVAPAAVVRHEERAAAGVRECGDAAELQRRHELRAALKNYRFPVRLLVEVELVLLALAEVVVAVGSGERERARRVGRAWRWNLRERASLREARRAVRELRQVGDMELVARMARRGRVRRFFRPELAAAEPPAPGGDAAFGEAASARLGSWWTRVQRGEVPSGQLTLAVLLVVLALFGLRDVLFARQPVVGQLVGLPNGLSLLGSYFGGVAAPGGVQPAPAAYGIVGLVGTVLANSSAAAVKVLELGVLAAGAVGASRLVRPFASSRGRLVGAAVFVLFPAAWNAIGTGNFEAAVAIGASPFFLARLARASGLEPFADGRPGGLVGEIVPFGLLLAAVVALAPPALLAVGVATAATAVALLTQGSARPACRVVAVAVGGALVALVVLMPWSFGFLEHGARWSAFTGAVPGAATGPASLLRGHTGPIGAWWGSFGLVVAAGYALVVATGSRFRVATSLFTVALAASALAWAGSEGWLGAGAGATAVIGAPVAAALAGCCGLGVVAFERDVTSGAFGWRHAAALVALVATVGGLLPVLGTSIGGRADQPEEGFAQVLDWTVPAAGHPYRVMWLGDPRALPGGGWQLQPGVAWTTSTEGLPGGTSLWPAASPGPLAAAGRDVLAAEAGATADVGRLLGPLGVRYLVIPTADAPLLSGSAPPPVTAPVAGRLLDALEAQGDLIERPVEAGAIVFVNADWRPAEGLGDVPALAPGHGEGALRSLGVVIGLAALAAALVEGVVRRRRWDRAPVPSSAAPPRPRRAPEELGDLDDEGVFS